MASEEKPVLTWEADTSTKAVYCIPIWLRDEQFKLSLARVKKRVEYSGVLRTEPIAVVGLGPSLKDTWEKIKDFKYIMTCSGSHQFLLERGIVPTYHVDVDPRPHKVDLMGKPHKDVKYLIASCCHPKMFDHLDGHDVSLWHVFSTQEEAMRLLPRGEWALTGGSNVGMRAIAMARFLGFTDIHIFGMDGCLSDEGKSHAIKHPNSQWDDPEPTILVHDGVEYKTTRLLLHYAKETLRELDQMPDIKATFYGDGLIQHVARTRIPNPIHKDEMILSIKKPEIISPKYKEKNYKLYLSNPLYGTDVLKRLDFIHKLIEETKPNSILDYGCGRGLLAQSLTFPIWEYDPAIPGKDESPRPAELVICVSVLEHVEPDKLIYVLDELRQCVLKWGFFVIDLKLAQKKYDNGRNTHLIVKPAKWWIKIVSDFFDVAKASESKTYLKMIVRPKIQVKSPEVNPGKIGFFDFSNLLINRDPYANGRCSNVVEPAFYAELCKTFPSSELSGKSLDKFIKRTAPWKKFYDFIKLPEFIDQVFAMLEHNRIKIVSTPDVKLNTQLEFVTLNAKNGQLKPHANHDSTVVTLILPMLASQDDWNKNWGGGITAFQPKASKAKLKSGKAGFDKFNIVKTYPYLVNHCLVFLKNNTSWRGVMPMKGPANIMRKAIIVSINYTKI
jgi:uncharacterized Rossmann fold enzyme